jgi:hypothetical protein
MEDEQMSVSLFKKVGNFFRAAPPKMAIENQRSSILSSNELSEEQFKATTEDKMTNVTQSPGECIDIWPYVKLIQASASLPQQVIDGNWVQYVYRSKTGRFDHVLVPAGRQNVFLVIIVDRPAMRVYGHRIVDLNELYGLDDAGNPRVDK